MSNSYLGSGDTEILEFAANMAAVLDAHGPEVLGLTLAQAGEFTAARAAFVAACDKVNVEATRTPVAYTQKQEAKDVVEGL